MDELRASWTLDAVADRERLADDVGFIGALLDKLVADHVTNPAQLDVVGVSNGALMA